MSDVPWKPIEELTNPVRWTFTMFTPFGTHTQFLDIELPDAHDSAPVAHEIGKMFYKASVAEATSVVVVAATMQTISLVDPHYGAVDAGLGVGGRRLGLPSGQDDTPCVIFNSGYLGRYARRRFWLPGAPSGWTGGGSITAQGESEIRTAMMGLLLGASRFFLPGSSQLILVGPLGEPAIPGGPQPLGYLPVTSMRVCLNTEKCPVGF